MPDSGKYNQSMGCFPAEGATKYCSKDAFPADNDPNPSRQYATPNSLTSVPKSIGSGHRPSCSNENQNSNAVEEQSTSDLPMKDIDDAADENVEESEDPPTTQGKPVDHQSPAWWDNDQNPKRLLVVTAYAALFLASAATCERAFQLKNFAKRLYPICRDGWDWRWGVISRKDRRRARKFLKR